VSWQLVALHFVNVLQVIALAAIAVWSKRAASDNKEAAATLVRIEENGSTSH
jgi:hypothetical protein